MICVNYCIEPSLIPNAGKGLFITESVVKGKIITAPTDIPNTIPLQELLMNPQNYHIDSSVRWFEDHCTVSPDWPDECYINHSFEPTGIWHLGFVFASKDLPVSTEITVDYRHLLAPNMEVDFYDKLTGKRIEGFRWLDSLRISTQQLTDCLFS